MYNLKGQTKYMYRMGVITGSSVQRFSLIYSRNKKHITTVSGVSLIHMLSLTYAFVRLFNVQLLLFFYFNGTFCVKDKTPFCFIIKLNPISDFYSTKYVSGLYLTWTILCRFLCKNKANANPAIRMRWATESDISYNTTNTFIF